MLYLVKDSLTRFAVLDFTFNCEDGGRFFFSYEQRFVDLQVRNRTTITRSTSINDRRQVALCLRMGIHLMKGPPHGLMEIRSKTIGSVELS